MPEAIRLAATSLHAEYAMPKHITAKILLSSNKAKSRLCVFKSFRMVERARKVLRCEGRDYLDCKFKNRGKTLEFAYISTDNPNFCFYYTKKNCRMPRPFQSFEMSQIEQTLHSQI